MGEHDTSKITLRNAKVLNILAANLNHFSYSLAKVRLKPDTTYDTKGGSKRTDPPLQG
jgi:hypothetical protein